MTDYISLAFEEDIDTADVEAFKHISGCIGASAYKNTLNLYFKTLTRKDLFNIALVLHQRMENKRLLLNSGALDDSSTATSIYEALREEAAI